MTQPSQPPADDAATSQTPCPRIAAARELLARTVDLPRRKGDRLAVLREYRAALAGFAVESDTSTAAPR